MAHTSVASEQHEANANLQLGNGPSRVYFKHTNMQSAPLAACTKPLPWRREGHTCSPGKDHSTPQGGGHPSKYTQKCQSHKHETAGVPKSHCSKRKYPALFLQKLCMQYDLYATSKQEIIRDEQGLHSKGHDFLTATLLQVTEQPTQYSAWQLPHLHEL